MKKVKILIVDDHQLIINGVTEMLKPVERFRIIGNAMNGEVGPMSFNGFMLFLCFLNEDRRTNNDVTQQW